MRSTQWMVVAVLCAVVFAGVALAGAMPGVADVQRISFTDPIRVGSTLLPKGDYEVRHVMQGQDHIMVFRALNKKNATEVRVQCTLVPLAQKANETQKIYTMNAANEPVLKELIFRGDTAKHVF